MPSCFVIQPFDGGKFDKRYRDCFFPAVKDAGLEPYRVDADPSVSVPIDQIEEGIKRATVCFADITLDNPNVWFELGFALASGKEICIICSEERQGKFPFDIQQRSIIRYKNDSASDYVDLRARITTRLEAILVKEETMAAISAPSLLKETGGLSQPEIIVLTAIVENLDGPKGFTIHWPLKNQMDRLGYNNLAVNIGVRRLARRRMIEIIEGTDNDNGDPATFYSVAHSGYDWLTDNADLLNLPSPGNSRSAGEEEFHF